MAKVDELLDNEITLEDLERIAWRRKVKLQQRGNFDEKYPEDVITAFLVAGNQYFSRQILIARKMELFNYKPNTVLRQGEGAIFHQRIPGRRYLVGADIATGRTVSSEETDWNAAACIDLETGEEVAMLHAHSTPEEFAYDLADIGTYFNNAEIAVERTGDGGTTILTLKGECRYGAVYRHKDWWKRERKIVEVEGFPTTVKTRPIALNKLNRFVSDFPDLMWDVGFFNEALTFVRNEKGIPAAAPGAHDDRVSCRWIAYYVRQVLLGYYDPIGAASER